jgi:predicted Rossmann fold flavoprotein
MEVAVLGGGAAGFFAAISCKRHHPEAQVTLYEKSSKLLSKVKVSGGGRCNVTHACFSASQLVKNFPRGQKALRKSFEIFQTTDTVNWFESRGVPLKTEDDGRMFPVTDDSQTIIDCLHSDAKKLGVVIQTKSQVTDIERLSDGYQLTWADHSNLNFDKVIVATGGSPKTDGFEWLKGLGHAIEPPVPSLFTFNFPKDPITALMGVSVSHATVWIERTKLRQTGPVLITHWGISGPAVLKLSAFGARTLHEMQYNFKTHINWLGNLNEEEVRTRIAEELETAYLRKIKNSRPFDLPSRLWYYLLELSGISVDTRWADLKKEHRNRLIKLLTNHEFDVEGKTTFKEEFVTCGGVSLADVDMQTMESRICPGLYFAGEVLDIDGITGGFNFQAAWTTGFIAGKLGSIKNEELIN